jgi:hypothetical protein
MSELHDQHLGSTTCTPKQQVTATGTVSDQMGCEWASGIDRIHCRGPRFPSPERKPALSLGEKVVPVELERTDL